jgi:hypothetical protein
MSQQDPQLRRLFRKAFPKEKPPVDKNPKGTSQFLSKLDPDRYKVFKETLLPNGEIFAVLMLVAIVIIGGTLPVGWDLTILSMTIMILILVFLWLGLHLYHFFIYRGSINRLPFPVIGWERLVNRRTIEYGLVWHHVTIQVKLNNASNGQISAIKAALYIFFKKAKKKFYTPDIFGLDPRREWEIMPEQTDFTQITASGSSNPEVVGQIYRLMRGNLTMLQNKFPGLIQEVNLSITDKYQQVAIDIPVSAA